MKNEGVGSMGGGPLGPLDSCVRSSPRARPWRARQGGEVGGASGRTKAEAQLCSSQLKVEGGVQPDPVRGLQVPRSDWQGWGVIARAQ